MNFSVKEDIIQLTQAWTGERFEDGRPKVPDKYLDILRTMTLEEVWQPLELAGYNFQFEEHLQRLHDDRKLVGRAVTAVFMPVRPDLDAVVQKIGAEEGRKGTCNQWVIDKLTDGDVAVIDMYDKIIEGTFVGGNLTTAIARKTRNGGAVIWGGVRDLEQMEKVPGVQVYFRGYDPTPIRNFVMTGYNAPVRIGGAVCMPGDIVFGYRGGVIFIPPHLVKSVIEGARKSHVKDIFGFEMIDRGVYTTADIDVDAWPTEMIQRLERFIQSDERGKDYRDLDWTSEREKAIETYGY